MDSYFLSVIEKLSLEDIDVLNKLTSTEATSKFSAQLKRNVFTQSQLSEAKFRKTLCRLEAMNFVQVVSGSRDHLLYVTEFGQMAIQTIFERSNV